MPLPDRRSSPKNGPVAAPGAANRTRRRGDVLILAGLGLEGVLLILALTAAHGVGTAPDSVAYISTAHNLLRGKGYVDYSGGNYLLWPPLYPTVLAFVGLAGLDLVVAARIVNAVAFGISACLAGLCLLRQGVSRWFALVGTASVLVAPALVGVSVVAFAEPLFMLFAQLFLCAYVRSGENGRRCYLLMAALAAGLACLTRFAGFTLVLTGCLLTTVAQRGSAPARLRRVTIFAAVAALPVAGWLTRNLVVSGTLAGHRGQSANSLTENAFAALGSTRAAVMGDIIPDGVGWLLLVLLVCTAVAVVTSRRLVSEDGLDAGVWPVAVPLTFVVVYLAGLIGSATVVSVSPMDRYAVPLFVPLVSLGLSTADRLVRRSRHKRVVCTAVGAIASVWLGAHGAATLRAGSRYVAEGAGFYATARWQESEVAAYLRDEIAPCDALYSNAPHGVYILTGLMAKPSPRRTYYYLAPGQNTDDVSQLSEELTAGAKACLVWFNEPLGEAPHYYRVAELQALFDVELVASLADGRVYALAPDRP